MLNVIFGRESCEHFVLDTRVWFSQHKKPEWFEDPFVKEFLKEVDNTEVLFEEALKDYRGRGISTEMISTGCKTLCDIYFDNEGTIFYGSAMGDNCIPFLIRISEQKDVTIVLEHYMDFPEHYFEEGKVACDGRVLGQYDYDDAFSNWGLTGEDL